MELAEQLAQGIAALRLGEPARAADLLGAVANDPELASADDLRDVYARTCSLYAQALLDAGRAAQARKPVQRALDALTALGDSDGLQAVRELQKQIGEAMASDFQAMARRRSSRALADKDIEVLLAAAPDDDRRADVLIKWATAALDHGRNEAARGAAVRALDFAQRAVNVRHEVFARIAWATASPAEAPFQLEAARRRADEADEFNLVGAVAKAAGQLDVSLSAPEEP